MSLDASPEGQSSLLVPDGLPQFDWLKRGACNAGFFWNAGMPEGRHLLEEVACSAEPHPLAERVGELMSRVLDPFTRTSVEVLAKLHALRRDLGQVLSGVIDLSGNDSLGFARHPALRAEQAYSILTHLGPQQSRVFQAEDSGHLSQGLEAFFGVGGDFGGGVTSVHTGTAANLVLLEAFFNCRFGASRAQERLPKFTVIFPREMHGSVHGPARRLFHAQQLETGFHYDDLDTLAGIIERVTPPALLVLEHTYSAYGARLSGPQKVRLRVILEKAHEKGILIAFDEAHSAFFENPTGAFKDEFPHHIFTGSPSKAPGGGIGCIVTGSPLLHGLFSQVSSQVLSSALDPALFAHTDAAISEHSRSGEQARAATLAFAQATKRHLRNFGFDVTGDNEAPMGLLYTGGTLSTIAFKNAAQRYGVLLAPFPYPSTVNPKRAGVRLGFYPVPAQFRDAYAYYVALVALEAARELVRLYPEEGPVTLDESIREVVRRNAHIPPLRARNFHDWSSSGLSVLMRAAEKRILR